MAIANVNGVDLYYEVHGSGEPLFLTHGSWGDATGWQAVIPGLTEQYEVVAWDRRGHSRSSDGDRPGSIEEDAADLAGLIEFLDRRGAFVYGSSSGGTVVLDLVTVRPDLVSRAAVHEPAVPELLKGTEDENTARLLADMQKHLETTRVMIEAGVGRGAAEYFIENVALGPGSWDWIPEQVKATFAANAPTYADELSDPTALIVDVDSLVRSEVPLMITIGTESPPLLRAVTQELMALLPAARTETLDGAGHIPYRTHPDLWLATVMPFYDVAGNRAGIT